jgi:hypothetical protein
MPSLLEAIENLRPGPKCCSFGRWYAAASDEDRSDIDTAMADKTVPSTRIATVLSERIGSPVVDYVRWHRRHGCEYCPKTAEYMNG